MKITSCFGTRLSGKLGNSLVACSRGEVNYVRTYVKPKNPKTPSQERQRAMFKDAVRAWQNLSDLQKVFYDRISEKMSGFNVFVGRYLKALRNGDEPEVPKTVRWTVLSGNLPENSHIVIYCNGRHILSVSLDDRDGEIALTYSDRPYMVAMESAIGDERIMTIEGLFETGAPITLKSRSLGIEIRLDLVNDAAGCLERGTVTASPRPEGVEAGDSRDFHSKDAMEPGESDVKRHESDQEVFSYDDAISGRMPRRSLYYLARTAHDRILRSGNLQAYMKTVKILARRSIREGLDIPWVDITSGLEPVATLLQHAPRIERRFMLDVASAHLSLVRALVHENQTSPNVVYLDYSASANVKYAFERDVRRATRQGYMSRQAIAETVEAGEMMRMMLGLLASYRRHLSYSAGLVRIRDGGYFELKRLATRPISTLEHIVIRRYDDVWVKLVLGDEYQHIQRAIMAKSVKISPRGDEVHLRDTFVPHERQIWSRESPLWKPPRRELWKGAYSLSVFASMIRQADAWERGWMLGRTMELVEAETHLTSLPVPDFE